MLVVALFSWWYTTAWAALGRKVEHRLSRVLNFFSVGMLLQTLFAPFRQIAAGKTQGNIDAQFRAMLDRLFSRFVGAAVRSIFIILGIFTTFFVMVFGIIQMILWPLVPLLPILGIIGFSAGWVL